MHCKCKAQISMKVHLYSGMELHTHKTLWACKWEKDCYELIHWQSVNTIFHYVTTSKDKFAVQHTCMIHKHILCFSTEIVQFSTACWEKRIRIIYKLKSLCPMKMLYTNAVWNGVRQISPCKGWCCFMRFIDLKVKARLSHTKLRF